MNRRDQPQQTGDRNATDRDASLEVLLTALREARPSPGLEDRLLLRLAAQPQPPARMRWRQWSVAVLVPAALAACALAVFGVHRSHRSMQPAEWQATENRSTAPLQSKTHFAAELAGQTRSARDASQASTNRVVARSTENAEGTSNTAHTPTVAAGQQTLEASFPAPEMPLTQQERLLMQIAHRNDPVQVALLDPKERSLAQMHERAESDRFFAPRPLPPELQHEIDVAVKAQYIAPQTNQDMTQP